MLTPNPQPPMEHRTCLGRSIIPCSYVENTSKGLRWYVETLHQPTGIPYDEQNSPKFSSLKAAREFVRDRAEVLKLSGVTLLSH